MMEEKNFGSFYRNLKQKLDQLEYNYPNTEIGSYIEFSRRLLDKIYELSYWKRRETESGFLADDSYKKELFPEIDFYKIPIQEMKQIRDYYISITSSAKAISFKRKTINAMNALINEYKKKFSTCSQKQVKKEYKKLYEEEKKLLDK